MFNLYDYINITIFCVLLSGNRTENTYLGYAKLLSRFFLESRQFFDTVF